jgi:hypothetical protein
LKRRAHAKGKRTFDIVAYIEPADQTIYVEAFESSVRAVYTFPDGHQFHQRESVEPMTAFSFQQALGSSAVDHLMDDVAAQLDRWA